MTHPSSRRLEREPLAAYAQPRLRRSMFEITTSVVPYLALSVLMYLALDVSYLLVLGLVIPTAGFLVRTFVVFHDCAHGSLFALQACQSLCRQAFRACSFCRRSDAGATITRSITRRRETSIGVASETSSRSPSTIQGARLERPTRLPSDTQSDRHVRAWPVIAMMVGPRIATRAQRPRMRHSVLSHRRRAPRPVIAAPVLGDRLGAFPARYGPLALLAGSVGIWLFYVQHQFEDAYWQSAGGWDYADAALRGSSYLKLPRRSCSS